MIVEKGWRFCGLGAQIAESVYSAAFDYLDAPIRACTGEDVPMPYSRPLEDAAIPDVPRVVAAVDRSVGQSERMSRMVRLGSWWLSASVRRVHG